jgi:hypothetical protein
MSSSPFSSSLKFKLWRRRLSVSAAHMTVRTQMPWYLKGLIILGTLLVGGALSLWTYGLENNIAGLNPAADRELLSNYKDQVEKLRTERDQFSTTVNAAESQINIERSAQKQLVMQVKTLETENARLKEDLAFFESLLPADTGPQGITIRRLKADILAPNQLRYQLLAMQGGKGDRIFAGNVQLIVTVMQAGKSAMITFPDGKPGEADKYKVSFKHYQRIEGVLTLPDGAVAKAVQARVLENGQIRTQMSANL